MIKSQKIIYIKKKRMKYNYILPNGTKCRNLKDVQNHLEIGQRAARNLVKFNIIVKQPIEAKKETKYERK